MWSTAWSRLSTSSSVSVMLPYSWRSEGAGDSPRASVERAPPSMVTPASLSAVCSPPNPAHIQVSQAVQLGGATNAGGVLCTRIPGWVAGLDRAGMPSSHCRPADWPAKPASKLSSQGI